MQQQQQQRKRHDEMRTKTRGAILRMRKIKEALEKLRKPTTRKVRYATREEKDEQGGNEQDEQSKRRRQQMENMKLNCTQHSPDKQYGIPDSENLPKNTLPTTKKLLRELTDLLVHFS